MYTFSYVTSPVLIRTNFRNTISWKCFVREDVESDRISILSSEQG